MRVITLDGCRLRDIGLKQEIWVSVVETSLESFTFSSLGGTLGRLYLGRTFLQDWRGSGVSDVQVLSFLVSKVEVGCIILG